jgi:hypothetical protein
MADPIAETKAAFDGRDATDHGVPAVVRFALALGPGEQGTLVRITEPGAYWLEVGQKTGSDVVVAELCTYQDHVDRIVARTAYLAELER